MGSSAPADILAALRPMPTKEQWEEEELHQYGLIAVDSKGNAMQLEKVGRATPPWSVRQANINHTLLQVTYDVAVKYLPTDVVKVGTSLGSFSLSAKLTEALMAEFAPELKEKKASLDSDPHFWMPLTMKEEDYEAVMSKKGTPVEESRAHFKRMAEFKARLGMEAVLGCVDAYWWDYGRLELYMTNNLFATEESPSAHALRTFMKLGESRQIHNKFGPELSVDPSAVVLNCSFNSGRIGPNCVLTGGGDEAMLAAQVNVAAPTVDVESCVIMQTTSLSRIAGKDGLLYNVVHDSVDDLLCNAVRADVFMPGGVHHVMQSARSIDGGKARS
ncbi:MAG: hypothetical protein SGPRY_007143, partial [Prymnesium sp.]